MLDRESAASLLGPEQKKLYDSMTEEEKQNWYNQYLQQESAQQSNGWNQFAANFFPALATGGLSLAASLPATAQENNKYNAAQANNIAANEMTAAVENAKRDASAKANTEQDKQEEIAEDVASNLAADTETNANTAATQKAINAGVGKSRAGLVNPNSTTATTYANTLGQARNAAVKTQNDYLESLGKQNQLQLDKNAANVNKWYQTIGSLFGSDEDLKEPPKSGLPASEDLNKLQGLLENVSSNDPEDADLMEKVEHLLSMLDELNRLKKGDL